MPPEQCLVHYITRSLKTHYITLPFQNHICMSSERSLIQEITVSVNDEYIMEHPLIKNEYKDFVSRFGTKSAGECVKNWVENFEEGERAASPFYERYVGNP